MSFDEKRHFNKTNVVQTISELIYQLANFDDLISL